MGQTSEDYDGDKPLSRPPAWKRCCLHTEWGCFFAEDEHQTHGWKHQFKSTRVGSGMGSSALNLGPQKVYPLSSTQNATKALGFSGTHSSPRDPGLHAAHGAPSVVPATGHQAHSVCGPLCLLFRSRGGLPPQAPGSLPHLLQAFAQHHLLTKTILNPLPKITSSLAPEALNTTPGSPRATCSPPVQVSPHRCLLGSVYQVSPPPCPRPGPTPHCPNNDG